MKYSVKKGSIGRALIPYRIKRPENRITVRYKRIRENKTAREIQNLVKENISYDKIAKDLGISKIEVLNTHNKNALRYGEKPTKTSITDMVNRGVSTKEISKFFNCKESHIIALLKDLDYKNNQTIEKEIDIAVKVRDLLEKYPDFNYISQKIKISRYNLFRLYNKYFKIYNNEIIDMKIIDKLINLNLSSNDIALFYEVPKEHIINLIKINEEMNIRVTKSKKVNSSQESLIDKAYKSSNIDFYELKMKNRR